MARPAPPRSALALGVSGSLVLALGACTLLSGLNADYKPQSATLGEGGSDGDVSPDGPEGDAMSDAPVPPEGGSVIVTSHDSGLLTRIDLASRRAVAAYDGGSGVEVLTYY